MGGKKAPNIDVPDPLAIIEAEKQANRTGTITPFGSSVWQGDNQVTEFSPQMQGLADRMISLAGQDGQRFQMPSFMNDIAGAMMGRVGERYGLDPSQATTKPQQSAPMPSPVAPPPMPPPSPVPGPMPTQPPIGPDPNVPNMPEPMPGGPPPGVGGPGMGVDPNQEQQLRNFLRDYNNMRFQVTRR